MLSTLACNKLPHQATMLTYLMLVLLHQRFTSNNANCDHVSSVLEYHTIESRHERVREGLQKAKSNQIYKDIVDRSCVLLIILRNKPKTRKKARKKRES